jgi:ABC-type multidrug transport system ATPase subunit
MFGRFANYVMQDDIIFSYFTVREALTFAARLKLKIPEDQQDQKIAKLIQDLGLVHVADSQVGSALKKVISGGERKRTAIGVELITEPNVVLLDEPTSGLDSFTAVKICKLLRKLAREQGKTICATIHQPSSQAFAFFDRLILMCDGHIVY